MQLYQQPLTPVDPLTQLMNNAKQLADLKTVFRTLSGDDDRKEAIVTAPAPTKETFIAELIMQSPDARKQMVSTLFGGLLGDGSAAAKEEKIPWYGRMLMSIAENPDVMRVAAPAVMGVVGMLVNKFGFNKPTTPPSAQPPGATIYPQVMTTDYPIPPQGDIHAPQGSTMPAGDVVAPTTTDLGDGEESEDTAPQMTLFELVLNSVLDNLYKQVPITDFKWLETLETQFPSEVAQMKTMLNTLPLPVLMAIISSYGPDYADAMQLPHAAAYLEVLVNQIKERENKRNEHSTSDSVDKSTVGGSGS
jgi:hypothetical protein